MVSLDRPVGRGQLILVGCLTLALVVIGIGLVINTTLFTESASPALSNVQVDTAGTFHLETRRGTRSLVHRINHGNPVRDAGMLEDNVTASVANYSSLLAVSYARSEPASIDVAYNHDRSHLGTRVIQRADDDFDDSLVGGLDPAEQPIGWLSINVNVSATQDQKINPFSIRIDGDSGGYVRWQAYRNETGRGTNLTVRGTFDDGSGTTTTNVSHCNPVRNRVLIDGISGELVADSCVGDEPFGLVDLESPYEVDHVRRPGKFGGKWELVTGEESAVDSTDIEDCDATNAPADYEACATPVVWTANVTATFHGHEAAYERERNISIYGAEP